MRAVAMRCADNWLHHRGLGPLGPHVLPRVRPDLLRKYQTPDIDPQTVASYLYHLNAQDPRSACLCLCPPTSHLIGRQR